MSWLKAGGAGVIGGAFLFVVLEFILFTGILAVPYSPGGEILQFLGLSSVYMLMSLNLLSGICWSLLLVWIFRNNVNLWAGFSLGFILWLGYNFIFTLLAGQGIFGLGVGYSLWESVVFIAGTLLIYLCFGSIIGYLNGRWIYFETGISEEISSYRE